MEWWMALAPPCQHSRGTETCGLVFCSCLPYVENTRPCHGRWSLFCHTAVRSPAGYASDSDPDLISLRSVGRQRPRCWNDRDLFRFRFQPIPSFVNSEFSVSELLNQKKKGTDSLLLLKQPINISFCIEMYICGHRRRPGSRKS
jgi:hypothetical protein